MSTVHRIINGKPYTLTRNSEGYGVCSAESRVDRFHRSYQVYTTPEGRPRKCTCPAFIHSGPAPDGSYKVCKHMREVDRIWLEVHPDYQQELNEQALQHGYFDSILFALNGG